MLNAKLHNLHYILHIMKDGQIKKNKNRRASSMCERSAKCVQSFFRKA
jgi:hypothetical protein